jgi:hypothetical protein
MSVRCKCGKSYKPGPELVGRQFRCKCGGLVVVSEEHVEQKRNRLKQVGAVALLLVGAFIGEAARQDALFPGQMLLGILICLGGLALWRKS